MNKDLKLQSLKIMPIVASMPKKYGKHAAFAVILVVLLTYVLVVVKIGSLSQAEPAPGQDVDTSKIIPRVNQKAINQIQALEGNNMQIHSLFEQARNNPFQE